MKTLPNEVTVFNATPHTITFWDPDWDAPVEVETDEVINAYPVEETFAVDGDITFVHTSFVGSPQGGTTARQALKDGADVVIGSIIAAKAYPGLVDAMTPAPGYERVGFADPLLAQCLKALREIEYNMPSVGLNYESLIHQLQEKTTQPSKRMDPFKFTTFEATEVFDE